MGHQISAIIGKRQAVRVFADRWTWAEVVDLPQDCGMVFLTDALFDGITQLFDGPGQEEPSSLTLFTSAIRRALEEAAHPGPLAYIETDYAGGYGTQAGVLLERGHQPAAADHRCLEPARRGRIRRPGAGALPPYARGMKEVDEPGSGV